MLVGLWGVLACNSDLELPLLKWPFSFDTDSGSCIGWYFCWDTRSYCKALLTALSDTFGSRLSLLIVFEPSKLNLLKRGNKSGDLTPPLSSRFTGLSVFTALQFSMLSLRGRNGVFSDTSVGFSNGVCGSLILWNITLWASLVANAILRFST